MKIQEHWDHWLMKWMLAKVNKASGEDYSAWGMTFYNHIWFSCKPDDSPMYHRAHERIHIEQMFAQPLTFHFRYYWQMIRNWFKYKSLYYAYRNITYEEEAYKNERMDKYQPKSFDPLFDPFSRRRR